MAISSINGASSIGERIKILRERSNISKSQLARMVGVSPTTISNYENGKTHPDMRTLVSLSSALGITVNMILRGYEPKK